MYGLKGVKPNGLSWTYLALPAGDKAKFSSSQNVLAPPRDEANVIRTAASVQTGTGAWRPGDWIAVATTSFSPWETEFVKIKAIIAEDVGSRIVLDQRLKFYHFGGPDPGNPSTDANYTAGAATNYGVDERAEVGLISRNIILTSDSDNPETTKTGEVS